MSSFFTKLRLFSKEFIPQSLVCFQSGYLKTHFWSDLFAGIGVGIIAVPLAIAFGIASGVSPAQGLATAIIAGFLISLLGGSLVQIGGPTGAFVVLIYGIMLKFGYSGLILATLVAGILMIFMGFARAGVLLKFIPYPVIVGFTTGIALVIFSSQIKDFFGLDIDTLPPEFIHKWKIYYHALYTWNGWAFCLALGSMSGLFLCRRFFPRLPSAMLILGLATALSSFFGLPIETISSKFGELPTTLPHFQLPVFSLDLLIKVFPSAITVALLGAIESLLSASIADGLTGHKHRSNCELVAQGFANIGAAFFGGMPATGAIARTSANIKLGARTPFAGIVHAATILGLMLFLAPFVGKIPLSALAGVLVYVAWNMSELPHFIEILRGQKGDALALLITFILTVLVDLTVAVQVGVIVSAIIFLKRMTDKTSLQIYQVLTDGKKGTEEDTQIFEEKLPPEIAMFEIDGPFFYSVSHLLDEVLIQQTTPLKVFVLCMHKTPLIDATGMRAIRQFHLKCQQKNIVFLIAGAKADLFKKSTLEDWLGKQHIFPTAELALAYARAIVNQTDPPLQSAVGC